MLKPIFKNIPDEFIHYPHWVNWRSVSRKEGGNPTKPPYQPNGILAESNNLATWSSFSVVADATPRYDGIGFVLSKDDPFVGLDFDHCRCNAFDTLDPKIAGGLNMVLPQVANYVRKLNSYTELSPSGKGIHVFLKGHLPVDGKKKGDYEAYQTGRYFTVTGHIIEGFPQTIKPRQMEVDAFYQAVFGAPENPPEQDKPARTGAPNSDWKVLLEKAFQSAKGAEIERLWKGDYSSYTSHSEADMAICSHLAFWFSGDPALIDAAFRESVLYRDKWDIKHHGDGRTYGEATIQKAIKSCSSFYSEYDPQDEKAATSLEDWSEPSPFNDYSHLPAFPVEMVPGVCGEMTSAISRSCQVDAGLPGNMMLAVLSVAIGARVQVNLDTHKEPGNLYTISVIGSGNRKTEVERQVSDPVYSYQREQQDALSSIIKRADNKRCILEKRLDKLQKKAADQDDSLEREKIVKSCDDVLKEMEANPVPRNPVYLVDDITPESLGQLMADNQERAAILSAEGGIFKIIGGLYHNGQANFDLFLKAHAGDFWSNNRIGREAKTMEHPALTLGLAVQPDVIEEIGRNSEFRGRGLSARFLYSYCQSKAGFRIRQSSPIPEDIKSAYHKKIVSLMSHDGKHELTLTPEAQALWDEFYNDVEKRLRPGSELEHLVDWGSKLPGAVARIAGLLHFADFTDGFLSNQISKNTVLSACVIGSYYLEHAKAVFGLMREDTEITTAKRILDYIKRSKPTTFKGRDLFNHTNCQSMQEIQPGLNILMERGYIREFGRHTTDKKAGRPESTSYEINPKILSNV
jgi:hypothetical protein